MATESRAVVAQGWGEELGQSHTVSGELFRMIMGMASQLYDFY